MGVPIIPAILTNANWQKEKGIVAKVSKGETGLGALMDALATAYKAVDINKFDAFLALPNTRDRTPENVDKAIVAAKAEYPKVLLLQKAAYNLRDRAKLVSAEWAKSKIIPSSSRKHVDAIALEADHYGVACKSMDMSSFEKMKKESAENEAKAKQMLAGWIASIKTGNAAVAKTTTYAEYTAKMYQKVRGLGTAIGNIPEYRTKWSPIFGNAGFSKGDYIKPDDKPDAIKTKTKAIMTKLAEFEAEAK